MYSVLTLTPSSSSCNSWSTIALHHLTDIRQLGEAVPVVPVMELSLLVDTLVTLQVHGLSCGKAQYSQWYLPILYLSSINKYKIIDIKGQNRLVCNVNKILSFPFISQNTKPCLSPTCCSPIHCRPSRQSPPYFTTIGRCPAWNILAETFRTQFIPTRNILTRNIPTTIHTD